MIGTSLTVHPFASLAQMPKRTCPRVLINIDRVSDFGRRPGDVVLLGKCDDTIVALAKELGWYEELLALWEETANSVEEFTETPLPAVIDTSKEAPAVAEGDVDETIAALAKELGSHEELEALWEQADGAEEFEEIPPPTATNTSKKAASAAEVDVEELATTLSAKMAVKDQDSKVPSDDKEPEDTEEGRPIPVARKGKGVAGPVPVQGEPLPLRVTPPSTPKRAAGSGEAKDDGKL